MLDCQLVQWNLLKGCETWHLPVTYSYFVKGVVSKKCMQLSQKVFWVVLVLQFLDFSISEKIWENGTRSHGRMFLSAKRRQQKYVSQLQCQGWTFWYCCVHFLPTFLSIIEELGGKLCLVTFSDRAKIFSLKCLLDAALEFVIEKMK